MPCSSPSFLFFFSWILSCIYHVYHSGQWTVFLPPTNPSPLPLGGLPPSPYLPPAHPLPPHPTTPTYPSYYKNMARKIYYRLFQWQCVVAFSFFWTEFGQVLIGGGLSAADTTCPPPPLLSVRSWLLLPYHPLPDFLLVFPCLSGIQLPLGEASQAPVRSLLSICLLSVSCMSSLCVVFVTFFICCNLLLLLSSLSLWFWDRFTQLPATPPLLPLPSFSPLQHGSLAGQCACILVLDVVALW